MMLSREPERIILHFVVTAAILLAVGCDSRDEQQPIILDETGWTTVTTYSNSNSLTRPLSTTSKTASSSGPQISISHQNPAQIDGSQFKIRVSISPNQDTSALVNPTTLTIKARKRVFGRLREKDITDDVMRLIHKKKCTRNGLCESLSVERTIKLSYGRGKYMFSIDVSDQAGQKTMSAFTITRV